MVEVSVPRKEDLKNAYLNEQGLKQERDALRALVEKLRAENEALKAVK